MGVCDDAHEYGEVIRVVPSDLFFIYPTIKKNEKNLC